MSGRTLMNGRYELEHAPVPGGAMGQVWFGRDTRLDREVAVKFIRFPDDGRDEVLVRRFHRESRVMARLEHPGVPAAYDWGEDRDRPFLVMQRVRGITVHDLVSEQVTLPIGWAAAIAAQVCAVLSAAHAAKLVHRDLKPANLMVEPTGTVKVLDFGLSVAPTLTDFSKITHSGQSPGTPAYMAPEQLLDGKEPGPASDLYALGCTLHEMVCGERPFTGSTSYHLMNQHVRDNPPALRDVCPEVPARLERLVLDLLAKRPEDRPASAEVVYERLLPFVRNLGTLAGVLDPPSQPSPIRMYAGVLSRVFAEAPPDTPPRHRPATDIVDTTPAGDDGPDDGSSRQSRLELADMWFDRGDYPNAARAYADIATELDPSQDADRALHCGKREATCYSRVGDGHRALRKLEQLLRDLLPVLEAGDTRITQLQKDIGLLQLGAGRRHEARRTFGGLPRDR
ncbi:serine/threonine-protein kinase [Micromonospora noduli]|uniref:serine/threonine-protein kinase n=1 Tax=Micromonospora noduli TaxID=709876 RepID=UPI000DC3F80E|nr:serine/threonine-protein kinase [Micromonospora noduli]RAO19425.1 Non-specific serine/threonine protein kinase [Micromonospora noduli]